MKTQSPDLFPANQLLVHNALCCCFGSIFMDFPALVGCSNKNELLCFELEFCARLNTPVYALEMKREAPYFCRAGTICCKWAIKWPKVFCRHKNHCLCCVNEASLPPNNEIPCTCTACFLTCFPLWGVAKRMHEIQEASIENHFGGNL